VLAGFLTTCCVESTMRTAYEKGFNVITLTDACATASPRASPCEQRLFSPPPLWRADRCATTSKEGQAVTGGSYGMFSTPMTVADYEKML